MIIPASPHACAFRAMRSPTQLSSHLPPFSTTSTSPRRAASIASRKISTLPQCRGREDATSQSALRQQGADGGGREARGCRSRRDASASKGVESSANVSTMWMIVGGVPHPDRWSGAHQSLSSALAARSTGDILFRSHFGRMTKCATSSLRDFLAAESRGRKENDKRRVSAPIHQR